MPKQKLLDVVLECMNKGMTPKDTQSHVKQLKSQGLVVEPKVRTYHESSCDAIPSDISPARWEQLEREYLISRGGEF